MVVEVRFKNGNSEKFINVDFVGVLTTHKEELYILARSRVRTTETFIPLSKIDSYNVREPH